MKAINTMLFALIAVTAAGSAVAGAVGGPKASTTRVEANSQDVFNVRFFGGELARVSIIGDGDTDLDLVVKDRFGDVVCRADGNSDAETCRFVPDVTATYRIEVRNLGRVYNAYRISTN
ncbi:MAG: hypothetical protein MUC68_03995 [Burkholderiaceae bacterium]|jgi:hypothetical protein|nr:hypothetical protein [Burkholderiaceae bacterium]